MTTGNTSPGSRAQQLFLALVELPPQSRRTYLDSHCSDDPSLRAEVESLLEHHDPTGEFMQRAAIDEVGLTSGSAGSDDHGDQVVGTLAQGVRIGQYTIQRVLGAGGMGVVYAAEQDSPRRLVALKLMRAGLISRNALRRFEQEAAALARLTHPSIARVYQAGTDTRADGVLMPFLAMELVEGVPLGQFLRGSKPGVPELLNLFLQLCEAVSHAHQRGVIHRDLKPANVMVQAESGAVHLKVLDFGIARLVGGTDHPATAQTQAGPMPGTLGYMSPEQLGVDPHAVDVRSDVYALGVILYEMLAGRLPVDVTKLSVFEAAKAVKLKEPAPLGQINRVCRGDLETIAARALEKDPARRYQSAAELAEDVRRFLRSEPILARPAGAGYRAAKFIRRHRVLVSATGAVMLALGAGLGFSVWQARLAAKEARTAREMSAFLREIFMAVDPERTRGEEPKVRDMLNDAAGRLASSKIADPAALGELHSTIGAVYQRLGDGDKAERHQREALRLFERAYGPDSLPALEQIGQIAWTMHTRGKPYEHHAWFRDAMEKAIAKTGRDSALSIGLMTAVANSSPGRTPESEQLYAEAYERSRRTLGPKDPLTIRCMSNACFMLLTGGKLEEAAPLADECFALHKEVLGPDHPRTLTAGHNVAILKQLRGDSDGAASMVVDLLAEGDRILGPAHTMQISRRANAAGIFIASGRYDEGVRQADIAIAASREKDGLPGQRTVQAMGYRTSFLILLKRFEDAERAATEVLEHTARLYNNDPEQLVNAWSLFYDLAEARGDTEAHAQWRAKIATTEAGRRALANEGRGEPADKGK